MEKFSFKPGELNPGLVSAEFGHPASSPKFVRAPGRTLDYVGAGVHHATRPSSQEPPYKAVVLKSFMIDNTDRGHNFHDTQSRPPKDENSKYNTKLAVYARIPELDPWPDPFDDPPPHLGIDEWTPEQIKELIEMHTIYVVSSTDEVMMTNQHITAKTTIWVDFEDRKNHQYGIITGIIDPPTGALAIEGFGSFTSLKELFAAYNEGTYSGPALGTGTPAGASSNAEAFIAKMKASPHLKDFSDVILAGLAANAQKESAFCPENAGDPRGSTAGGSAHAIFSKSCSGREREHCSFGYWQMNVCSEGAGGQRFAKFHGISLNDKEALHAAITDPEKQFEVIADEMIKLFGDDVYEESWPDWTGAETAEWFGQEIAEKYEGCKHCSKNDTSWVERGNIAADIYNKYIPARTQYEIGVADGSIIGLKVVGAAPGTLGASRASSTPESPADEPKVISPLAGLDLDLETKQQIYDVLNKGLETNLESFTTILSAPGKVLK
jgi:hypothetical protein